MMRCAYVLFEGLPPTVIDTQVLTHVRLVRERLALDMPVISFACTEQVFAQAQARLDHARALTGGPVFLHRGVRPGLPGSAILNRQRLARALDELGPLSALHVRGDYASSVTGPLARRRGVPMLWDCRGDSAAEVLERSETAPLWMKPVLSWRAATARREARNAGANCFAACFVSDALLDLMAPHIGGKPSWVLPCLCNEDEFFFDSAMRTAMRRELGFADADVVYIYSGSLVGYQKFDEVVTEFAAILKRQPQARLVVLTPDSAAAARMMVSLPANCVTCRAVGHREVNNYLNAADFAFLLRDPNPVNTVAFPTKFAEYALAGVKIIMKNDPPSCVRAARDLGIYTALAQVGKGPEADYDRAAVALAARQTMGRGANLARFAKVYAALEQVKP